MRIISTIAITVVILFCAACTTMHLEQTPVTLIPIGEEAIPAEGKALQNTETTTFMEEANESSDFIRLFSDRDILVNQQDFSDMASFIGWWHKMSHFGSEYHSRYIFHPNFTFAYFTNMMDGMDRDRAIYGYWWVKDKQLVLEMVAQFIWVGGKLVAASGSTATDYEITGDFKTLLKYLEKPEIIPMGFGDISYGDEYTKYGLSAFTRNIGGVNYWMFADLKCNYNLPEGIEEVRNILNRRSYDNKVCGYEIYMGD